jgi:hypothetical protein
MPDIRDRGHSTLDNDPSGVFEFGENDDLSFRLAIEGPGARTQGITMRIAMKRLGRESLSFRPLNFDVL